MTGLEVRDGRAEEGLELSAVRQHWADMVDTDDGQEEEEEEKEWVRTDYDCKGLRTTHSGGPGWHRVHRRTIVADGVLIEYLSVEGLERGNDG